MPRRWNASAGLCQNPCGRRILSTWPRSSSVSARSSRAARTGPRAVAAAAGGPPRAERLWAVSAERPLERRPGLQGLRSPTRSSGCCGRCCAGTSSRWRAEQRVFNDAVLKLVDELLEEVDRGAARVTSRAARTLGELEERLTRVERRGPVGAAPATTVAAQPAAAAVPDYFAFEARMRGSTADVRERQRPYVDDFRDAAPVLDVGCGRGEFLALLREAGIEARGVDADADMVAYARGEGLDVEQADALAYLEALDGRLARRDLRRPGRRAPAAAPTLVRLLELAAREAPPRRPARRRDDQPALAARAAHLLRRPDARAAARAGDARAARAAGRLPRGRDALPERAGGAAREPDDPVIAANVAG